MSLAAGDKLGPYEVLASLGAGGMGEVYRAHDARLNREVAIKRRPGAPNGVPMARSCSTSLPGRQAVPPHHHAASGRDRTSSDHGRAELAGRAEAVIALKSRVSGLGGTNQPIILTSTQ